MATHFEKKLTEPRETTVCVELTWDLVVFLRARLDEDERVARATLWEGSGNKAEWVEEASATLSIGVEDIITLDCTVNTHIVRWDPARVLAEVEAKRGIISRCEKLLAEREASSELDWAADFFAHDVLRDLAAPYASHPDYIPGWVPADTASP